MVRCQLAIERGEVQTSAQLGGRKTGLWVKRGRWERPRAGVPPGDLSRTGSHKPGLRLPGLGSGQERGAQG